MRFYLKNILFLLLIGSLTACFSDSDSGSQPAGSMPADDRVGQPSDDTVIDNYIVHGDGTVTDTETGLMWMRCGLGQTWDGNICINTDNEQLIYTWGQLPPPEGGSLS